jgi:hypothetical protein
LHVATTSSLSGAVNCLTTLSVSGQANFVLLPNIGGSALNLNHLSSVSISTPVADGQVLKYNSAGGKWINDTDLSGGASSETFTATHIQTTSLSVLGTMSVSSSAKFGGPVAVHPTGVYADSSADLQLNTTNLATKWSFHTGGWGANATGVSWSVAKSRHATIGSHTVLQSGDDILEWTARGSDGDQFVTAAQIKASVDAAPGDNDMPGRITFLTTPNGGSSSLEAMRIDSQQRILNGQGHELGIAKLFSGAISNVLAITASFSSSAYSQIEVRACYMVSSHASSQARVGLSTDSGGSTFLLGNVTKTSPGSVSWGAATAFQVTTRIAIIAGARVFHSGTGFATNGVLISGPDTDFTWFDTTSTATTGTAINQLFFTHTSAGTTKTMSQGYITVYGIK